MTEYVFDQMTVSQALFIDGFDTVDVRIGSATRTTVLFNDNGTYTITIEDKTLTFGSAFRDVASAVNGLIYPDESDLYIGGPGDDSVDLSVGRVPRDGAAYGGVGADRLTTLSGNWLLQGNQGDDRITTNGGRNTIYGGQDNDTISIAGSAGPTFAQGNKGNDSINGGVSFDTLLGGQGNDTIFGQGGVDFVNGNLGDDVLDGVGQVFGEDGADTLSTGIVGENTLRGGAGDDRITAAGQFSLGARNVMFGDDGNDFIQSSSPKHDEMFGGAGNDTINSFNQEDVGDLQDGGGGNDFLVGGYGLDTLIGGDGADTLLGSYQGDILTGGLGPDQFVIDASSMLTPAGADRVLDWTPGEDVISINGVAQGGVVGHYAEATAADFSDALAKAQAMMADRTIVAMAIAVGADVVIFAGSATLKAVESTMMLVGRSLADISSDNFV